MTEQEIILKARDAFERRDAAAKALQEIDNEIKGLVKDYSMTVRLWGFTPLMLKRVVHERLGLPA